MEYYCTNCGGHLGKPPGKKEGDLIVCPHCSGKTNLVPSSKSEVQSLKNPELVKNLISLLIIVFTALRDML